MAADADQQQLRQLREQLAAREQEVTALREIAEAASELQAQDVQAAKVIELSKKNRSLNLLVEKERLKVAKLQQALSQAAAAAAPAAAAAAGGRGGGQLEALSGELSAAKERVQQLTNRMGQMEQKAFLLEGENKRLVRALAREVGDDVPLSKVLEEGSDWKGRREQIVHLKDTVRQLREAAGVAAVAPALAKHETQHRSVIGRLNKERGAEMERMAAELEAARRAAEDLRLQCAGTQSRRKVLEAEVSGLKEKLAVVLAKTQNDDKLIAALRAELAAGPRGRAGPGGDGGGAARAFVGGHLHGELEAPGLRGRCVQLEEQVEQQQKIILYLQGQQAAPGQQQHAEELEEENKELRRRLEALQDAVGLQAQRPGTSGLSSALRQQVLALQEENAQLRAQGYAAQPPASPQPPPQAEEPSEEQHQGPAQQSLQLTQSQQLVLEAAKEAVAVPSPRDDGGGEQDEVAALGGGGGGGE